MDPEQELEKGNSLLLSSEDGANGFSVAIDNQDNITLLRWDKEIAWFSVALSKETVKQFVELVKYYERSGQAV